MMRRRPDSSAEAVALDALATIPAFDSQWRAHVRRLGARTTNAVVFRSDDKVRWTIVFVAFLGYIVAITTYRLPIGNLAMLVGLGALALHPELFRFSKLLIWFGAFILWCAIGYVRTPYPAPVWDKLI